MFQKDKELYDNLTKCPHWNKKPLSYGTSGFRFHSSILPYIAYRVGFFLSRFSQKIYPECVGIVFTASHNPAEDNGVKIIRNNGEMLYLKEEKILQEFVNEYDLEKGLKLLEDKVEFDKDEKKGVIILGRDTRDSGSLLVDLFIQGTQYYQAEILDLNFCTTPQVYSCVEIYNKNNAQGKNLSGQQIKDFYIEKNIEKFNQILDLLEKQREIKMKQLVFDCAHGVGYYTLKEFYNRGLDRYWTIDIINDVNCEKNDLNNECGAEYVHKLKQFPKNFKFESKYGVCVDGDADRLIYFNNINKEIQMIDGDKQIALMGLFLNTALRDVLKIKDELDLVVVNTQYSDFGVVDYIKQFGIKVMTVPTGVKHTHHEAVKHDISIYAEANGHGTLMIKEDFLQSIESKIDFNNGEQKLVWELLNFRNNLTGDAIFNFLQLELFQLYLNLDQDQWFEIFKPKNTLTYKIKIGFKENLKVDEYKGIVEEPEDIQGLLDQLQEQFKEDNLRIFIRSSGTEDVVRIHLEWNADAVNLQKEENLKKLQSTIDEFLLAHKGLNQFIY